MGYTADEAIAARRAARLTQEQLAGRLEMTDTRSIIRWEREGITDRSHYIAAFEEVLGLGRHARTAPPPVADTEAARVLRQIDDVTFWTEAMRRSGRAADQADAAERPTDNLRLDRSVVADLDDEAGDPAQEA